MSCADRVAGRLRGLIAVVCLLGLCGTGRARADEPELRRVRRIALLPPRDYSGDPAELFQAPAPGQTMGSRTQGLLDALGEGLEAEGLVRVFQGQELRDRVSGTRQYAEQVALARERLTLGREHFLALRQKEAVHSLSRAVDVFERVFQQVVSPTEVADALEFWGVALVESGMQGRAHVALRRMFHTEPSRRFQPGYHPEPVVRALDAAYRDLATSIERTTPFVRAETTVDFLRQGAFDVLLLPVLVRREGSVWLELYAYEAPHGYLQWRDAVPLDGSDADAARLDRMGSRWLACTPFELVRSAEEKPRRTQLAAHFAHEVFFRVPTRTVLNELGVSVEWFQRLTPFLDLMVRVDALTLVPDRFEDIRPGYSTVRGTLGPLFAWTSRRWSVYGGVGLSVQYIGRFEKTTSPDCKFWDEGSAAYALRCRPSDRQEFPPDLLMGANAMMGVRFYATPGFFLSASASMALFVFPFDRSIEMNFPFTSMVGGGTRF